MNIDDLAISVSEMPPDTLFNFIKELRSRRRVSITEAAKLKRTKTKKGGKSKEGKSISDLINSLSAEDAENLIKLLDK
jgi:hypothetical protein